jgi:hypothetical protein
VDELEMPQIQMVLQDEQVKYEIAFLTPAEYQTAVDWIGNHFTFLYGQQIDWSHDSDAVLGNIKDLKEEALLLLLKRHNVEVSRRVMIIWTYADTGIKLPLSLLAKHINNLWLPGIDDVFVVDIHDVWCLELYHEGNFSYGRTHNEQSFKELWEG